MRRHPLLVACIAALALAGCKPPATDTAATASVSTTPAETQIPASSDYAVVPLKADLSGFDENGKRMIALLVQAAQVMGVNEKMVRNYLKRARDKIRAELQNETHTRFESVFAAAPVPVVRWMLGAACSALPKAYTKSTATACWTRPYRNRPMWAPPSVRPPAECARLPN